MWDGEALAQTPRRLDTQGAIQLYSCGTGPMQIGGLCRLYRKLLVVAQQRGVPELIRRVQSRDSRWPYLFDHPILGEISC